MKSNSVKLNITIWYTIALSFLSIISIISIIIIGKYRNERKLNESLMIASEQFYREIEIEYEDESIGIDDIDFISRGIYISVYDVQGNMLMGRIPDGFYTQVPFSDDNTFSDKNYMIYDNSYFCENYGRILVRCISDTKEASGNLSFVVFGSLIVLPLFIIFSALIGYGITKRAFKPIEKMTSTADMIEKSGDLSRRIGTDKGYGEIALLAENFDKMLGRLENAFENEKRFTSDASHELRTPASVISAECEYALLCPESAQNSLKIIKKESDKLKKIISALLMLARAESGRQKLSLSDVDLNVIIESVIEEYAEKARIKNMTINFSCESDATLLYADDALMTQFFINLIDNAIKYGNENGKTIVSIFEDAQSVSGYVYNDCDSLTDEQLPKLFERFYRSDNSRHTEGSGLGLSIVHWIAVLHSGSVHAESTEYDKNSKGLKIIFSFKKNKKIN